MNSVVRNLTVLLLALGTSIGLPACGATNASAPSSTPVTIQLSWSHQAQFAGFYAAEQNGYYAAEGLDVTFVEGGPSIQTLNPVINKSAHFGIAGGDQLLLWRAGGYPVQAIATILRRSPRVYIALAESGITRPQDFIGKTISVGRNGQPLLDAMMIHLGINPDQYTVLESNPALSEFYAGQVQVRSVFLTNEVLAAQRAGYNINVIYPDDYGIHFNGDTIFTTDELIAANPGLICRFLAATLKGWTYTVENPAEVGPLVGKYNPQADQTLETDKMTASLPLVNTGEDFIGWMKPEIWAGMEETLRTQGVLTQPLKVDEVYTLQFLQEIYHK